VDRQMLYFLLYAIKCDYKEHNREHSLNSSWWREPVVNHQGTIYSPALLMLLGQ